MEKNKTSKNTGVFNPTITKLVIVGLVAVGLISLGMKVTKDVHVSNVVNIQQATEKEETLFLGYMETMEDSEYVRLPLSTSQSYDRGYSKKSTTSERNVLFVNTITKQQHWLLPNNNFLITKSTDLYNKSADDASRYEDDKLNIDPSSQLPIAATLYYVIEADTNNDGALTVDDSMSLAITNSNGKKYIKLSDDFMMLNGYTFNENNELLIIYQRGDMSYIATIDLKEFSVLTNIELTHYHNKK